MATAIGTITRAATRGTSPLRVLTFPTHERYQAGLAGSNAMFYMVQSPQVKTWDRRYAPLPANHILLNPSRGDKQIPSDVDFDVVLSQNKFGQFQIASQLAKLYGLPLISLEHTLPVPSWPKSYVDQVKTLRGHLNVFISNYSIKQWGWDEEDHSVRVIHHGVDTSTFCPNPMGVDRKPTLLSVVNDWINRDIFCGYKLWRDVTEGLPVVVVGDTPGLSQPTASVADLVMKYRQSEVFVNTSLVSPIPTSLLEAMACGCAPVAAATCMIPEVIKNGANGFISNDPKELRSYCEMLLNDRRLCRQIGEQARLTVLNRFSSEKFVKNWDKLLIEAANLVGV
jgi:glycosyltransferase involved in cell wall biosynthesis